MQAKAFNVIDLSNRFAATSTDWPFPIFTRRALWRTVLFEKLANREQLLVAVTTFEAFFVILPTESADCVVIFR